MTLLLTTHDLRHVERCCTAVAIIKAGRVIASGSPHELVSRALGVDVEVEGIGLREEILAQDAKRRTVDFLSDRRLRVPHPVPAAAAESRSAPS